METKYLKLLYNVLCARMPYHVMVNCGTDICEVFSVEGNDMTIHGSHPIEACKPMLRSMSRMTDKERVNVHSLETLVSNEKMHIINLILARYQRMQQFLL